MGHAYRHYYPFVSFLFLTGCRPGEAIALSWGDVLKETIVFNGSVYRHGSQRFKTAGSKNNKKRLFPCNDKLKTLLEEIKPVDVLSSDWVFPSLRGKDINYGNFSNRA
ncbi:tyrosine-type recombinase/integrase [Lusitaniella coriacea]|uniref:tyrosine-type recombinase/integrase n=1 Tax=Lusitaniella coriacea TaxID=1983105 RepID=UPI003CF9E0AA